ncbi:sugar phosphate isomerase/epimerase [Aquirufa ecclesiirivi]|uniref:sugar phosphate isomerase/epimerase family protein n=1 Tax=Aquirufa ecclesiirivi TaxID=2715124 RepID=UPI0022A81292|nr:TIM barrel protein [Aquirufa ecclesiirivi]MCZ2472435.1 sugar phosphate isomerase/epimerase [Aquirufa ecclesiirivi]
MSTHLPKNSSRRQFLLSGSLATMGLFLAGKANASSLLLAAKPDSKFAGVQIGAITYSYRSLPGSIEQVLQYCIDSNISAIELMGDAAEDFAGKPKNPNPRPMMGPPAPGQARPQMTDEQRAKMAAYQKEVAEWRASVSMDKFKEVKKMFDKAGIDIYAFKPNALGPNNTDAEVEYALKAAKALGAKSVTIELPTDPAQSQRLGDLGAKHKMYIGYHLHTTATDTAWDVALGQSPYNSMNLDCGHYIAAGGNNTTASLLKLIESKSDRITSMHIKDRKNKDNGGQNQVWGQGNTPLKEILTLMKEKKYKFPATIELEYDIPAGSDPVSEVKKCVAYAKNILVG